MCRGKSGRQRHHRARNRSRPRLHRQRREAADGLDRREGGANPGDDRPGAARPAQHVPALPELVAGAGHLLLRRQSRQVLPARRGEEDARGAVHQQALADPGSAGRDAALRPQDPRRPGDPLVLLPAAQLQARRQAADGGPCAWRPARACRHLGYAASATMEAEILAAHGYAVVLPNFRVTPGFGAKIYKAGFGAFGRQMSEDHEDAVKWAIDQGFADPNRVCISGASYGGYAVLQGAREDARDVQVRRRRAGRQRPRDAAHLGRRRHWPTTTSGVQFWHQLVGQNDANKTALARQLAGPHGPADQGAGVHVCRRRRHPHAAGADPGDGERARAGRATRPRPC